MANSQPFPSRRPAGRSPFDSIRCVEENSDGTTFEYWTGRELMTHLGYDRWDSFRDAIDRAKASCRNFSGNPDEHFKACWIQAPRGNRGAIQQVEDVQLSDYACSLIAMNGDGRKREIAAAQAYFAIQTRRAELHLPPLSAPPAPLPVETLRPWAERFSRTFMPHIRDLHLKHPGCFSVVSATVNEIMYIEDQVVRHLMTTRGFDRPDISIGGRYSRFRKDDMLWPDTIRSAVLYLPDQDMNVEVKVYEGKEWPDFSVWFRSTYLTEHLEYYLNHKKELKAYPELTRYSTADNASRDLGGLPSRMPPPIRAALAAAKGFAPAPKSLPSA